ncbi:protein-tyrosine sulfotransferase [Caerostris extrusa]|uniref:Protein-tyrosine sulfotransferase n=1 Tax=Caerostris extrusa TaxID=172846 RepID=A0AAV4Q9Q0_CAEEX|nr:protein-tyrosine sulfotransferase [Caerostris extrusa]
MFPICHLLTPCLDKKETTLTTNKYLDTYANDDICGPEVRHGLRRNISSDLKYPKSTVAYVIKKWKVSGDCRNVPRVGRPTKLGDRDRRGLTREIRKNRTQPMALIREEFQQANGSIVSMNTIRKEAHLHGFHGRAAAHKPLITKYNRSARLMWGKSTSKLDCRSMETDSLE